MTELVVTSLHEGDKDFLTQSVEHIFDMAERSSAKTLRDAVSKDLGRMRVYFEEHNFQLFGSLDSIDRVIEGEPTTPVGAIPA